MNDNDILSLLCSSEREAAKLILQAHDILAECKTNRRDVVTEYDRRVQELLIRRITETVPDARFFCEENDRHDDLGAEHVFIIDPIGGTMNFVHGFHHSCISAAYMSRGELRAAAICNPYADELFTAVKGAGAFLNGRPIRVSDAPLAETLVCCGTTPYNPELADRCFDLMKKAYLAGLDVRREGAAALDLCTGQGRCFLRAEPVPLGLCRGQAHRRGGGRRVPHDRRQSFADGRLAPLGGGGRPAGGGRAAASGKINTANSGRGAQPLPRSVPILFSV